MEIVNLADRRYKKAPPGSGFQAGLFSEGMAFGASHLDVDYVDVTVPSTNIRPPNKQLTKIPARSVSR